MYINKFINIILMSFFLHNPYLIPNITLIFDLAIISQLSLSFYLDELHYICTHII